MWLIIIYNAKKIAIEISAKLNERKNNFEILPLLAKFYPNFRSLLSYAQVCAYENELLC